MLLLGLACQAPLSEASGTDPVAHGLGAIQASAGHDEPVCVVQSFEGLGNVSTSTTMPGESEQEIHPMPDTKAL